MSADFTTSSILTRESAAEAAFELTGSLEWTMPIRPTDADLDLLYRSTKPIREDQSFDDHECWRQGEGLGTQPQVIEL